MVVTYGQTHTVLPSRYRDCSVLKNTMLMLSYDTSVTFSGKHLSGEPHKIFSK